MCACQALDLLAPLRSSPPLVSALAHVRSKVPRLVDDRPPSPDIAAITREIASGALLAHCGLALR